MSKIFKLAICISLYLYEVACEGGTHYWKPTKDISAKSYFLSSILQSVSADSQVQCAMRAFGNRMFCYKNNICDISDLDIPPIQNISVPTAICYTVSSEFESKSY